MNKKIGIMGGTFNPIHYGHLALAQAAYDYCGLDEVWFVPSGVSYLKSQCEIVSASHRLEMTKLAINEIPYFKCSDIELRREGNTYTVDTLCQLHEEYPEHDFYFIMGADSLFGLPTWKEPEKIAKLCTLIAVIRDDVNMQELQSHQLHLERTLAARILLVPFSKVDISSSKIRNKLKNNEFVGDMLPDNVLEYIQENGLY